MSLFLKNLPNSFFRTVVSSRPIFNKATSLFSSIVINLEKPSSRPVASVGRTHARSICFGNPNEDRKKLIWKNLAARPYGKKPKPKPKSVTKSKSETKGKGAPKKISSGGVTCAIEQGQMQCQIDCEKLGVKKPKSEGDLPAKKAAGDKTKKAEDCRKKVEAKKSSTKTEKKSKSADCDKKSKKSATPLTKKTSKVSNKPSKKEVPKKEKKSSNERCEVKDVKALTGTWVSKKCVKYDFKCPGGVKEKGTEPEKVDECYEMKKSESKSQPPKKESKSKDCSTKGSKKNEESKGESKGKIPIQECIESCSKKKKPQEEGKASAKSKKSKECQDKKKDEKSCKPCSSKKGIVEDKNEPRHGSNTKLMCGVFDTKFKNTDSDTAAKVEKLTKELAECRRNRSTELNKKINECLPSPNLDSTLPKPKEQDKDVVSGGKSFLKSVCDGIFSKESGAVKSKSALAMSHTKSGDGGAKKSKSADCKLEAKPDKKKTDSKVKKSKSDPCARGKDHDMNKKNKDKVKKSKSDSCTQGKSHEMKGDKKKEDASLRKSKSDPCTIPCGTQKKKEKAKKADEGQSAVEKKSKDDCGRVSRPKPPCRYKDFKSKPTKKEATKQKDCIELKIKKEGDHECLELPASKPTKKKDAPKKEATKQKDCIELKVKKEGDHECLELPPSKATKKKDATKQKDCIELKTKKEGDRECFELPPAKSKTSVKSEKKKSKPKTDVCKKKSRDNVKSEKGEVFCAEQCSKKEEESKGKVCPCPPPAVRKSKRGKPAKKKSERRMVCTDDPDRKAKLHPVRRCGDDGQKKKAKGKVSPEKKHSQQLVELCRKIGAAATKKSEDQPKYPGPPDQSPIMQCIAFAKKKQKADTPQKGKGNPPRDKKPCSSDNKVYKKIVEFSEETGKIKPFVPCQHEEIKPGIRQEKVVEFSGETEKKQGGVKPFVPCQHEEIKPGIRHDGRGDVDKKSKSEDDTCKKIKKKQKLPKCATKKTKKKAKKKAKNKSKQSKKKESKVSVAEDKSKIGQRTCPKIANPCKSQNEEKKKGEDKVVCDCSENEDKGKSEADEKKGKDGIVCDCSGTEEKKDPDKKVDCGRSKKDKSKDTEDA